MKRFKLVTPVQIMLDLFARPDFCGLKISISEPHYTYRSNKILKSFDGYKIVQVLIFTTLILAAAQNICSGSCAGRA